MITTLTEDQTSKFASYVSDYIEKGLTTKQRTLKDARRDFTAFQLHVLKKDKPAPVVLFDSPLKCWQAIKAHVAKSGNKEKLYFVWPYFDCQFWASWFSYYDFMKNEVGIKYKNDKEYNAFRNCLEYGMVFPLDDLCVVCQPPTEIHRNSSGLHNEHGPAFSYGGDNEIYALNGVIMKKEQVMIPSNQMTADSVLKETNIEVRRELLRKIGIERLLTDLPHKLLETKGNYELYSIELSAEIKDAKYLKMTNPSIGVFHLEGVDPTINTIAAALKWRNQNLFENAEILT